VRCELSDVVLHSYFDGELSEHHAAQYERHLQYCVDCSVALVEQELLSHRLELPQLYQRAPGVLTRKIRGNLRSLSSGELGTPPLVWRWLAAASLLLVTLITLAVWKVSPQLRSRGYEAELAGEIVEMHRHSLLQRQMKGIQSNNERVVRQWFDGRLEFAVPVRDFADEGFALQGGRLDDIEGRSVAAVVYEGNGHLINLFMWPTEEADKSPHAGPLGSYQWIYWRKQKVEFCLVSDGTRGELARLYQLMDE
jgi:anti-sigma factor RsiW